MARAASSASRSSSPPPRVPDCPSSETSIQVPLSRGVDPLSAVTMISTAQRRSVISRRVMAIQSIGPQALIDERLTVFIGSYDGRND